MLRVAKLRAGGHHYYLEPTGVAGGPGVEPPGRWTGRGAAAMGLHGTVQGVVLEQVLAGRDPHGRALPGADRSRVVVTGFDLTFCAPKSVSILHGVGEPDVSASVRAGHDRAVGAALSYLEERALAVRRRSGPAGRQLLAADAAPAAAFVHRTSRALDPHLHTHVVLANVARAPDGSWSALDGRGVYAHVGAAGALYHAQLRHELAGSLGVAWGPLRNGRADLEGIGPEARREFSRRSQQIAAHLAERGLSGTDGGLSRRAAHVAGLVTRPPKVLELAAEDLRPVWRQRALGLGLGPRRLEAVLGRGPIAARTTTTPGGAPVDEQAVASALAATRHPERAFARRDVVRAWSASLPTGAPASQVAEVVDRFLDDVAGGAGRGGADAPGVGEPRVVLPERLRPLAPDRDRGRELEGLLERRGMQRGAELGRRPERAREPGLELGFG